MWSFIDCYFEEQRRNYCNITDCPFHTKQNPGACSKPPYELCMEEKIENGKIVIIKQKPF